MRIVVIGSGVVGTIYAWKLAEAGHEVWVVARARRRTALRHGLELSVVDQRRKRALVQATFRPQVVAQLADVPDPELVLICVQRPQRHTLRAQLTSCPISCPVLFLQQQWGDWRTWRELLPPERCLLGYPAIGGGRDRRGVFGWLLPESTSIGTADGGASPSLLPVASALRAAGLTVDLRTSMPALLAARAVIRVGLAGGVLKAGSVGHLAMSDSILSEVLRAIHEGLAVCAAQRIDVRQLPLVQAYCDEPALVRRRLQRMLRRPLTRCALGGCLAHTLPELRELHGDMLATAREQKVPAPVLTTLGSWFRSLPAIDRFVHAQPETMSIPRPGCDLCDNCCAG
ncbi:MAG: 2-dehydropantoate 2-reductase N-terminal domain-containing protein [Chloroflexi bacterium OHK40]